MLQFIGRSWAFPWLSFANKFDWNFQKSKYSKLISSASCQADSQQLLFLEMKTIILNGEIDLDLSKRNSNNNLECHMRVSSKQTDGTNFRRYFRHFQTLTLSHQVGIHPLSRFQLFDSSFRVNDSSEQNNRLMRYRMVRFLQILLFLLAFKVENCMNFNESALNTSATAQLAAKKTH